MTSNIATVSSTVEQVLAPQHLSYAGEAINALEARDQQIADGLRDIARRHGLQSSIVEDALVEVGLVQPAPEPVAEANAEGVVDSNVLGTILNRLDTISQRLDRAAQQAARHGIRF